MFQPAVSGSTRPMATVRKMIAKASVTQAYRPAGNPHHLRKFTSQLAKTSLWSLWLLEYCCGHNLNPSDGLVSKQLSELGLPSKLYLCSVANFFFKRHET